MILQTASRRACSTAVRSEVSRRAARSIVLSPTGRVRYWGGGNLLAVAAEAGSARVSGQDGLFGGEEHKVGR